MDEKSLKRLLDQVRDGKTSTDVALKQLKHLDFEELGFAKIDHHRALRRGFPEVILGEGKTPKQVATIMKTMRERNGRNILATRVNPEMAKVVIQENPDTEYNELARTLVCCPHDPEVVGAGLILVVTAGTSDLPVAEEAIVTAKLMGNRVQGLHDVGVAGVHRVISHVELLLEAAVIIVVAGMEGALPSVVSGMTDAPVIAVPTSVGYGTSFGGITALLGMLNSCATGVTVVNIDNGFGAAYAASMINRLPGKLDKRTGGKK